MITLDPARFDAALLDLDGVITNTAVLHARVWKALFDDYLSRAATPATSARPFDIATDYPQYVDGKPRYEGVLSFLQSRAISLPWGAPDDAPGQATICGLGNRKNVLFQAALTKDGVAVFPASIAFVTALRQHGLRTALVSSSKNARAVMDTSGTGHLFDICVDGQVALRAGLAGKPAPDVFLHAATLLGVSIARTFAVEDAPAGVEAARRAGCSLVVGIARDGDGRELQARGAHITVKELTEISMNNLSEKSGLPHALQQQEQIVSRLQGKRPVLFLDYDGTLTPIVDRPELAVLDPAMRSAVAELARRCAVAIVSGRDRADVEQLVGLDSLIYAGSHGFDIRGPGGLRLEYEGAAAFLPALDAAEKQIRDALSGTHGALVERKRFALAVHYRLVAPRDVPAVEGAVEAALQAQPGLRRTGGKMVFELRPRVPWHKGKAVLWLMEVLQLDGADVLPIYIGDDDTDEDAFAALRTLGLGIVVAEAARPSAAQYRLDTPGEVGSFLRALISMTGPAGT